MTIPNTCPKNNTGSYRNTAYTSTMTDPNRLIHQKLGGNTDIFSFSEYIHWQTKRKVNMICPAVPQVSRGMEISGLCIKLLNLKLLSNNRYITDAMGASIAKSRNQ